MSVCYLTEICIIALNYRPIVRTTTRRLTLGLVRLPTTEESRKKRVFVLTKLIFQTFN